MELLDKTILITRAASQSESLREGLVQLGARVVECPAIEISSYQWLLFTSANAVECFMKQVMTIDVEHPIPIAVVGSATAAKLKEWHLNPSLVPGDFHAEGVLAAFPSDLSGVRILFPRAEAAREILPDELRKRGATVDVLPVYRTVKAAGLQDLRRRLATEKIDCAVFTSPSTIRFMAEALEPDFPAILRGVPIAVIGPVSREAAASLGLTVSIEPIQSTVKDRRCYRWQR